MFNTYPRHGILEFKNVPEDPITLESVGGVKPNVKRRLKSHNARRLKRTPAIEVL